MLSRLKAIDIETMSALQEKVNIIPLIAKADTLTQPELKALKAKVCTPLFPLIIVIISTDASSKIVKELLENRINVFRPMADQEDEDATKECLGLLVSLSDFIINSTTHPSRPQCPLPL